MPNIFRTDNPLLYTQLEGVIVTEKQPLPSVVGAGVNNTILVGQFQRGAKNTPTLISSISEVASIFGDDMSYGGNKALRLKGWSSVYITRVVADDAVKASWTQVVSSNNVLTFTAKDEGAYGNDITVAISDGTDTDTKKFIFKLGDIEETFNNVEALAGKTNAQLNEIFRTSVLLDVSDAHATAGVDNTSTEQSLTSGSDGNISATDYKTALDASNLNVSGKIYITDMQSTAIKSQLTSFITTNQAGACIIGPNDLDVSVADAITDAETYSDANGRIMYAYNPVKYNVNGVIEEESPVFLAASILSLLPPQVSPAAARSTRYTANATGVKFTISRANYILLKNAGIMAFENDQNLGVKIVSGVTRTDSYSVLRRRMSDFYIDSVSNFLKNFQDEPNSMITRGAIRAAIQNFDENLVFNGILPGDDEVIDGRAFSVRTEGITTDSERAEGILKVEIKRRLFPAARYLVLIATIGESVVVEEGS